MPRSRHSLLNSFRSAFKGIKYALWERNFLIQAMLGSFALVLALILDIPALERVIVVILVSLVLAVEIINTAVERLLDKIINELHEDVAIIKELMAGAVFVLSISSLLVGLWIFGRAIMR